MQQDLLRFKSRLRILWINGYFVATTGGATSEVVNAMSTTSATGELIPHLNTIKAEDVS
ncbi:hypothetical protein AB0B39_15135 [Micromonospora sp. NPDC049114]|uniref:hypothetical protein n=1 Tax=Micromonospora sp. NPDC049114 TaxID=3155498 RepID=UPI0033D52EE7